MTVLSPVAALGGSFSLAPSADSRVTLDEVERAHALATRFLHEYAELVRDYNIQDGDSFSAGSHAGTVAITNCAEDAAHDFAEQY